MSNLQKTLQTNKPVVIGNDSYEFPLLDIFDCAKLDDNRKTDLKAVGKANAKEQNLTSADIYNIIMDIDARDFTVGELLTWATTPRGAASVCERSLLKGGKTPSEARKIISLIDLTDLVTLGQTLLISPKHKEAENPNGDSQAVSTPKTPANPSGGAVSLDTTSTSMTASTKVEKPDKTLGFGE